MCGEKDRDIDLASLQAGVGWLVEKFTKKTPPPKSNIDTQNDGCFSMYLRLQTWLCWVSMLDFRGINFVPKI